MRESLKGLARGITAPLWPGQRGPEEKPDSWEMQELALSVGLDAFRPRQARGPRHRVEARPVCRGMLFVGPAFVLTYCGRSVMKE